MDIKMNKIPEFNESVVLEDLATAAAGTEVIIPFEEVDQKTVVLVTNDGAASADVTFKKGDMLQGTEDKVISVPANKTIAVALESGKFKTKEGNVKATVSASLGFQLVVLP